MSSRTLRIWLIVVFISFLLTAVFGLILRYAFVEGLPEGIQYRNLQHAHSHVGMMGWLYGAIYVFIVLIYNLERKIYTRIFWISQFAVLGMLLSFPVQGYGAVSIFFTSLHLILSYIFIASVFRDLKKSNNYPSHLLLKTALVLLFISTLGTWALGAIMNSPLKGTSWYYGAIQFFLHFQFNGWFVFAITALFTKYLEGKKININKTYFIKFYYTLLLSCFLTFFLALTWSTPTTFLFLTNSIGVIIQIFALYFLWKMLIAEKMSIKHLIQYDVFRLWKIAFFLLSLKILMQSLVAIPRLAILSYTIRNFVIGFIHLLMLGVLSLFLMGLIRAYKKTNTSLEKWGVNIFILGFLITEFALFLQGLLLWLGRGFISGYYQFIFIASILFPIAIMFYLTDLLKTKLDGFRM